MKTSTLKWAGVIPAMTTAFKPDYSVDHAFMAKHAQWLVKNGCAGIVALGSLGESATLRVEEKVMILRTLVEAMGGDFRLWQVLRRLARWKRWNSPRQRRKSAARA